MIKTVKIAPSILSADFSVLGDVVKKNLMKVIVIIFILMLWMDTLFPI